MASIQKKLQVRLSIWNLSCMLLLREPFKITQHVVSAGRLDWGPLSPPFNRFHNKFTEWSPGRQQIQATELLPSGLASGQTHRMITDFWHTAKPFPPNHSLLFSVLHEWPSSWFSSSQAPLTALHLAAENRINRPNGSQRNTLQVWELPLNHVTLWHLRASATVWTTVKVHICPWPDGIKTLTSSSLGFGFQRNDPGNRSSGNSHKEKCANGKWLSGAKTIWITNKFVTGNLKYLIKS